MNLLSLFDGIGGFPMAWANINNIKYDELEYKSSEIEPFLLKVIENNFKKSKQLFDVSKISTEKLSADIITMGTPCTGFSISGKRDGLENPESKLFSTGVDVISKVRPKYFIWENVYGVFSAQQGSVFREVLEQFKLIGYDLVWTTLDTKYFGIPHRRRRVYLIGVRDGISENNNIFQFKKRQSEDLIKKIKESDLAFNFDFNINSKKPEDHFAFFNRQRSDKFREIGLSNTIAKRDYKGSTDIVVKNGSVRRIVPKERLRLQGIPDTWFDCTYKDYKSDIQRFKANGMSIPVVEYVFQELKRIESKDCFNVNSADLLYDKIEIESTTALNIYKNKKNGGNINLTKSGQMLLDRDENGNIKSDNVKFILVKNGAESNTTINLQSIESFLEDEVDEKFHLKEGGLEGFLKRELKSGNELPKKMKEVIFYKYPSLRKKYDKN